MNNTVWIRRIDRIVDGLTMAGLVAALLGVMTMVAAVSGLLPGSVLWPSELVAAAGFAAVLAARLVDLLADHLIGTRL